MAYCIIKVVAVNVQTSESIFLLSSAEIMLNLLKSASEFWDEIKVVVLIYVFMSFQGLNCAEILLTQQIIDFQSCFYHYYQSFSDVWIPRHWCQTKTFLMPNDKLLHNDALLERDHDPFRVSTKVSEYQKWTFSSQIESIEFSKR